MRKLLLLILVAFMTVQVDAQKIYFSTATGVDLKCTELTKVCQLTGKGYILSDTEIGLGQNPKTKDVVVGIHIAWTEHDENMSQIRDGREYYIKPTVEEGDPITFVFDDGTSIVGTAVRKSTAFISSLYIDYIDLTEYYYLENNAIDDLTNKKCVKVIVKTDYEDYEFPIKSNKVSKAIKKALRSLQ